MSNELEKDMLDARLDKLDWSYPENATWEPTQAGVPTLYTFEPGDMTAYRILVSGLPKEGLPHMGIPRSSRWKYVMVTYLRGGESLSWMIPITHDVVPGDFGTTATAYTRRVLTRFVNLLFRKYR